MADQKVEQKVYDIVSMPGDGIGKVVLEQTVRLLNEIGFKANYHHGDIGWEFWCKEGNALPDRTIALLEKYRLGLFGAITSKPNKEAQKELDPSLQGKGFVYQSPIVKMRQKFDLDICVRPCKSIPGNPLNFIRRTAKGIYEPPVNAVIFRQNTECLYSGVEWTNPPDQVWEAFKTHKNFAPFAKLKKEDVAISARIFSRPACIRICEAAFAHAKKFGFKSVTVCEKPNVVRETSGMLLEEARKIQKASYPEIQVYDTNIDAQMMWMTKNPEDYEVIISSNMFGDICSDGFAGLVGGLGFACSANIGRNCAVFEPTHGSAPKYEKYKTSIVNPIACILSAVMMLEYLGEQKMADKIRAAVAKVVKDGKVQTYDMKMLRGCPEVLQQGAASTIEMTTAILEAYREIEAAEKKN